MSDFSVGDVVMLKSGSPKMTVININSPENGGAVFCHYFNQETQSITELMGLNPKLLKKVEEEEKPYPAKFM